MTKEQFLDIAWEMVRVLESNTNKAIVRNVIREVENESATIALAITEIRRELRGSDADKDDPKIDEALKLLNDAVGND